MQAIYFDNEGHVIHYEVSTPKPGVVVPLSQPSHGPQFLLTYELKGALMTGRFQMQMPGQSDWRTYLEWSGSNSKYKRRADGRSHVGYYTGANRP
jgi:hypothetical protein